MLKPRLIRTGKLPSKQDYKLVETLLGLEVGVNPRPNKFYRFDGAVDSIPSHLVKVLKEFGYEVQNMEDLLDSWSHLTGHCRHFEISSGKDSAKFSIPFYRQTYLELDTFNLGHEDMHAVQHLDLIGVYPILDQRLMEQGYAINLQSVEDIENQANIAGLLRVLEKNQNPKQLLSFPEIKSTYEYMQDNKV